MIARLSKMAALRVQARMIRALGRQRASQGAAKTRLQVSATIDDLPPFTLCYGDGFHRQNFPR